MSKIPSRKQETRAKTFSPKTESALSRKRNSLSEFLWNLPSGESLTGFALRFGFLTPSLLDSSNARLAGRARFRRVP